MKHRYPKNEKLKSLTQISSLFENGNKVFSYPFILFYMPYDFPNGNIKFGVSARKKDFKKAVDRNLIKRRMRECYRLNKPALQEVIGDKKYIFMLVFVGKEIMNFQQMNRHYLQLLSLLQEKNS